MPGGHLGAIRAKLAEASWRLDDRSRNVGLYGPLPALSRWQGDRRAFHCIVYTAAWGTVYVVAMLFLTPALSSYLILNLLLFLALFLFGYLTQAIPGVTFSMQIAFLQSSHLWV